MRLHSRIVNELGNTIDIAVSRDDQGITLAMAGPDSLCENIITQAEAQTLNTLLTQLLAEGSQPL